MYVCMYVRICIQIIQNVDMALVTKNSIVVCSIDNKCKSVVVHLHRKLYIVYGLSL